MKVFKFGGKSLGDKEKIEKIANFIKKEAKKDKLMVVVSAMGETTDKLIKMSKEFSPKPQLRELDMLLSCGEIISASLLAIKLNDLKVKATGLQGWQAGIYVEGEFGQAKIKKIDKSKIEEKFISNDVLVVTGFQGIEDGEIKTLGRGGSDTTAVALALAFNCPVEIFSDFDGIFAGDPRNEKYLKFDEIDYDFAYDYALTGAKVLAAESAFLAKEGRAAVKCKSSEQPEKNGTIVVEMPKPVLAINVKKDLCEITLLFHNLVKNIQKNVDFIAKNVNFYKLSVDNNKIVILLNQSESKLVEEKLAKLNNLLEDKD